MLEEQRPINPLLQKLRGNPIAGEGKIKYIENKEGLKLACRIWGSEEEAEKILIVLHGMGGHSEFFVILADHVVDLKVLVIAPDYRGHGLSEGRRGDLKDFKLILDDTHEIIELVKSKHANKPIILLGESMGGCAAVNYQVQYPNDAECIILFSPAIKMNVKFSAKDMLLGMMSLLVYPFSPGARIISARGREHVGIRNENHIQYDATDPLHLDKFSPRYVLRLNKYIKKAFKEAVHELSCPILIFQGTEDNAVSPEGVQEFFDKCPSEDKTLYLIEHGYHTLMTDPYALDLGLWEKLRKWISEHP
ncbi:MAG: alpha/beta fold hydrolase [Candidatus Helarchaeota archaeon]